MKKKRISQETLNLSILTLITILAWAGLNIYRAYTKTNIKPDIRKQLTPLNPKLDTETLNYLEKLEKIPFEKIDQFSFEPIIEEENISPENEATETGSEAETEPQSTVD